jgi:hypothetical protein
MIVLEASAKAIHDFAVEYISGRNEQTFITAKTQAGPENVILAA